MVGLGGFEPPTSPLSGVRSNQLSYKPIAASSPTHEGREGREPAQTAPSLEDVSSDEGT